MRREDLTRMKSARLMVVAAVVAIFTSGAAWGGSNPGPVKFSLMNIFETHSMMSDSYGGFSGETVNTLMLTGYRELQKNVVGSIYYINRYDFDRKGFITHGGGASLIRVFNPYLIGMIGYTYTSNTPNSGAFYIPRDDKDRMMVSVIYKVNPSVKHGPMYSLTTGYGSLTDLTEQQTFSEKAAVKIPINSGKSDVGLAYNFTYGLSDSEHYTNQWSMNLNHKISNTTKVSLSFLYIENLFAGSPGDDKVVRLAVTQNLR
jgi:hypothetical protein